MTLDVNTTGVYDISFNLSWTGSANTTFHWAIFVDGVKLDECSMETKVGAAMDTASGSARGLHNLTVGNVVDLRVTADGDVKTVTVNHASLIVRKVTR